MQFLPKKTPFIPIFPKLKRYFWFLVFLLFYIFLGFSSNIAKALTTSEFIEVKNGFVKENGILSDDKGSVFLEFLKNTYTSLEADRQPYTGNILPPAIINAPIKRPRIRTREILTFELLSETLEPLNFVDKYFLLHPKEHLRTVLNSEENLTRSGGVKVLIAIEEEKDWRLPQLWVLKTKTVQKRGQFKEVEYWDKIGGKIIEDSKIKIFSAVINQTGTFMLLDENPPPFYKESDPLETVELVEQSPFPSVPERETPEPNINPNKSKNSSENTDSHLGDNINNAEDDFIPDFLDNDLADDSNFPDTSIFPEETGFVPESNLDSDNLLPNSSFANETQLDIIPAIENPNTNTNASPLTNETPLDNIGSIVPTIGGIGGTNDLLSPLPLNNTSNNQSNATSNEETPSDDNNFAQNLGANFLGNKSINQEKNLNPEESDRKRKPKDPEKKIPIGLILAFFVLGSGTYYTLRG